MPPVCHTITSVRLQSRADVRNDNIEYILDILCKKKKKTSVGGRIMVSLP